MTAEGIATLISSHRFRYSSETELQHKIAGLLVHHGVDHQREFRLDDKDRPDFMVGSIVVEVKIKGSFMQAMMQLQRYAEHERVTELVLVSSRAVHTQVPETINGKPLHLASLLAGAF